ncbi:uncharacterized protein LOC130796739 [Amaranthus tricolor]|uniref:uncharacterized protein LOC130796739 n=1 Tax=Amaranthus tricolor TaxID=29722 RepID=UPI00258B5CC2|nr:uncharacterized protein LOC130796739 [Amaranthus tricolor]
MVQLAHNLLSEVELISTHLDSAEGQKLSNYHPNDRNEIRRVYLMKGPYQPKLQIFPQTKIGDKMQVGGQGGAEAFISEGFNQWDKKTLAMQSRHIDKNYKIRLTASFDYKIHRLKTHCFAHQLQLTLVAVAKDHTKIAYFFNWLTMLFNVVRESNKRQDMLKEKQAEKLLERLKMGVTNSGKGLDQESTLRRDGDTRWGSDYHSFVNLKIMFDAMIEVLDFFAQDGRERDQRGETSFLSRTLQTFDFIFCLKLMLNILGITNVLSKALQRRDQDIENVVKLVKFCKEELQKMRDEGWDSLLKDVINFYEQHEIFVPIMNDNFFVNGKSRRYNVALLSC